MRKRRDGYTLMELLLVVAVLMALAALAYPTLNGLAAGGNGLTGKRGQQAALDELRGRVAEARARAMSDGRAYRLAVLPGKGNYRVAPDENFTSPSSDSAAGARVLVRDGALPQGSFFCDADGAPATVRSSDEPTALPEGQANPSSYQAVVTFLPDGTARDAGRIAVCTVEAPPVIVTFQASTGLLNTQEK